MNDYFHILAFIALLAPLCSFITICLVPGSHSKAISVASLAWMLPAVISAAVLLVSFWNHEAIVIRIDWFAVGDLAFSADLALSNRSLLMLAVVAVISFLVHNY